jgi:HEPN domain-containing protein
MAFLRQYEILFKKASADFAAAKILHKTFEDAETSLDLEIVMFHLQQSVEKLLKSLLSKHNIHVTKTHSLTQLFNQLAEHSIDLTLTANHFIGLENYAIEGRYAIIHDDINDVENFILLVSELQESISKKLH